MSRSLPTRERQSQGSGFVVLVGPDGSGKTTVASELVEQFCGETRYVHFRPSVLRRPDKQPLEGRPPGPKRSDSGPAFVGWLRLARSLTQFWLGYLLWIGPARRRGALIIGDRWIYGYVTQPSAVGFAGPDWAARLACHLAPSPDLLVRLSSDSATIAGRKDDLTPRQIENEERIWDTISGVGMRLDARLEPSDSARRILAELTHPRK